MVGSGVTGAEFASAYQSLGIPVTLGDIRGRRGGVEHRVPPGPDHRPVCDAGDDRNPGQDGTGAAGM